MEYRKLPRGNEKISIIGIGTSGICESGEKEIEAEGVEISVMKAFAGGQLLSAETSPFHRALTEFQCIQYALDKRS